jgi:hypothetical protein
MSYLDYLSLCEEQMDISIDITIFDIQEYGSESEEEEIKSAKTS